MNRLQKNQTAEPAEFGGLRSPSAIQFNFQSGPSLNAQVLIDDAKFPMAQLGSARQRNAGYSQRKLEAGGGLSSVDRERNIHLLKNHGTLGIQAQNALTPQGRGGDPRSGRGRFAEHFGLIGTELAQLPAGSRRIGAVGMSEWEVQTPRNAEHRPALFVEPSGADGQKRADYCLSSRPLRLARGQQSQQLVTEASQPSRPRAGVDGQMRHAQAPGHHADGAALRPLRNILSITTDTPQAKKSLAAQYKYGQPLHQRQGNHTALEGAVEGVRIQDVANERAWMTNDSVASRIVEAQEASLRGTTFRLSRGPDAAEEARPDTDATGGEREGAMPSLRSPKIDPQQFSPRTADANIC